MVLKKNIRELRKFHSLTQFELAEKIGIGKRNICAYENGISEPPICNLVKIAKFFNVTVDDLLNKEMHIETEVRFKEVL